MPAIKSMGGRFLCYGYATPQFERLSWDAVCEMMRRRVYEWINLNIKGLLPFGIALRYADIVRKC